MGVGGDGLAADDLDVLVVRRQRAEEAAGDKLGGRVLGADLDEKVGAGDDLRAVLDDREGRVLCDAERRCGGKNLGRGVGDNVLDGGVRAADVSRAADEGRLWWRERVERQT
jgi:hypothetical protein